MIVHDGPIANKQNSHGVEHPFAPESIAMFVTPVISIGNLEHLVPTGSFIA